MKKASGGIAQRYHAYADYLMAEGAAFSSLQKSILSKVCKVGKDHYNALNTKEIH
jgi:hypothetical protein